MEQKYSTLEDYSNHLYISGTTGYEDGIENRLEIHVKMDPDYGHNSKLHKGYNAYTYAMICNLDHNSKSGNEGNRDVDTPGKRTRNARIVENII